MIQGRPVVAGEAAGTDAFLALASIVADEMYGRPIPVVASAPERRWARSTASSDLGVGATGRAADSRTSAHRGYHA
jgi:hypothetical protein